MHPEGQQWQFFYVASLYDLGVVLKVAFRLEHNGYASRPLATGPAPAGDDGPATSAPAALPLWSCARCRDNLYISDTDAATVRVVDAATGVIQTIAGTPGQRDYRRNGRDDGPATAATLGSPDRVTALDGNGDFSSRMVYHDCGKQ